MVRDLLKANPGRVEDDQLTAMRVEHKNKYGAIGMRALRFTEGGYCTLFSEGMKLKTQTGGPHGKRNALIATACSKVYDDEFGHMLKGIVGLDIEGLTQDEWRHLERISVEQLKGRIVMRNSQFGYPLDAKTLDDALNGRIAPLAFDYAKAEARLAA